MNVLWGEPRGSTKATSFISRIGKMSTSYLNLNSSLFTFFIDQTFTKKYTFWKAIVYVHGSSFPEPKLWTDNKIMNYLQLYLRTIFIYE